MTRPVAGWQCSVFIVIAWLGIAAIGCGRTDVGKISGKVTFSGQPLPFGSIAFMGPDGAMASGMIQNGEYLVADAALGQSKVAIQSMPMPPTMRPATQQGGAPAPAPSSAHVAIPANYSLADQSGLTYTVVAGEQTQNFDLKPETK